MWSKCNKKGLTTNEKKRKKIAIKVFEIFWKPNIKISSSAINVYIFYKLHVCSELSHVLGQLPIKSSHLVIFIAGRDLTETTRSPLSFEVTQSNVYWQERRTIARAYLQYTLTRFSRAMTLTRAPGWSWCRCGLSVAFG